jgi:hypothetical protein
MDQAWPRHKISTVPFSGERQVKLVIAHGTGGVSEVVQFLTRTAR